MTGRRGRHRRVVRPAGTPGEAPAPSTEPGPTAADSSADAEQTRDDTDLGWGETPGGAARSAADVARLERERWEADRPPHWG